MARKYLIDTFGCQMNYHDAERMAGLLEEDGFEPAASDADADLVVVNTCSVRERAEEKLYTRLGEIREMARETGRNPIVAVTGCVAQQEGEALLARSPGIIDITRKTMTERPNRTGKTESSRLATQAGMNSLRKGSPVPVREPAKAGTATW